MTLPGRSDDSDDVYYHDKTKNEMKLCAVQIALRENDEHPLAATRRTIATIESIHASNNNNGNGSDAIDLYILPELAPIGYSEHTFATFLPQTTSKTASPDGDKNGKQQEASVDAAIQLLDEIDRLLADAARRLQVYLCYGTVGTSHAAAADAKDDDDKDDITAATALTIRQVVLNRQGQVMTTYDKGYLCDYGVCAETRFFTPGYREPVSFAIGNFRLGLLICADIRYPELMRRLAREHQVDVLLQPAAFARDLSFRTWRSFRETRAVENSCYLVGVNYAGAMFGESSIVPPWVDEHHEPATLGTEPGYLIGCIRRSTLDEVRTNMPFYRHLFDEK